MDTGVKEKTCLTCRHYLGDGYCAASLEDECAEGQHEAWEERTNETD